jgi:hypothetical protein
MADDAWRFSIACSLGIWSALSGLFAEILDEFVDYAVPAIGVCGSFAFSQNVWPLLGEPTIQIEPGTFGDRVCVREDRFRRAFRNADATVDTFIRMNYEHIVAHIEAVDGTDLDAVHEFAFDAIVGHDVGHSVSFAAAPAASMSAWRAL